MLGSRPRIVDVTNLLELDSGLDEAAQSCRAIVETPRGCRSKYDYDPETGLFILAGVLPAGMAFPLAFGFVPGTRGADGDPLDILFLADEDLPVGCLVEAQLLGIIEARQSGDKGMVRNDRLVAKVRQSRAYADITTLAQLGDAFAHELTRFFETYNALKDKRFEVQRIGDAAAAANAIAAARRDAVR